MSGRGEHDHVRSLVLDVARAGRELTDAEITRLRRHVAQVGFDPTATTRGGRRVIGLVWQGRRLTGSERLPVDIAHYLRHVIAGREWPSGTTLDAYVRSLQLAVLDLRSGILLEVVHGVTRLTFLALAGPWRGPEGSDWILVGYDIDYGYWTTGYQLRESLGERARRADIQERRWLREPS